MNSFVAIKLADDLSKATNLTKDLYGADVLISFELIRELLNYESRVYGLSLTHSQDKDYIRNVVYAINVILSSKYAEHWNKIKELTGSSVENLISFMEKYINVLLESQHDTYTSPFEIVTSNMGKLILLIFFYCVFILLFFQCWV